MKRVCVYSVALFILKFLSLSFCVFLKKTFVFDKECLLLVINRSFLCECVSFVRN